MHAWQRWLGTAIIAGTGAVAGAQTQAMLSGKVTDADGKPVAGAALTLFRFASGESADGSYEVERLSHTESGANGGYAITNFIGEAATAMGILTAEKEGYALGWANRHPRASTNTDIVLGPPATLQGRVIDEAGNSVTDATVSVSLLVTRAAGSMSYLVNDSRTGLLTVRTDAQGHFAFTALPAEASAEFRITAPGRATVSTFDPEAGRGEFLQYTPGQEGIALRLPVGGGVAGTVVDQATGKPVANVRVTVRRGRRQRMPGQEPVTVAAGGAFAFAALAPGEWQLALAAPTTNGLPEWVAEPLEVRVEAGQTTPNVNLPVTRGGLLEVMVAAANSRAPITNAQVQVSLISQERGESFLGRSGDSGIACFRLCPGAYNVGAYREGYAYPRQSTMATVSSGATARVEVQLASLPKISGTVRDEVGNVVTGACVAVLPVRGDVTTDAAGEFEVTPDLRGWGSEGGDMAGVLVVRQAARGLAAAVDLPEGNQILDVRLRRGARLAGRVTDTDGKPLPGARITVNLCGERWSQKLPGPPVTCREDGHFEVPALPVERSYSVETAADGYGRKAERVEVPGGAAGATPLADLVLAPASMSVSGMVLDEEEKPVAAASVDAYGDEQPHRTRVRTGRDGRFTLDGVCAAPLQIIARDGKSERYGSASAKGGATNVVVRFGSRAEMLARQEEPPSYVGKPLPEIRTAAGERAFDAAAARPVLVCFWDVDQRPSRHCVQQLRAAADGLAAKGVTVAMVHVGGAGADAVKRWANAEHVAQSIVIPEAEQRRMQARWGMRGLPWLVLADASHVVRAEGFSAEELDARLTALPAK